MLQLKLEWHFFATSHGKGVVDGIGGTVKRTVLRAVNSRQCIVSGAESFLSAAKKNNTKVKLLLVLSNEIVEAAQNQKVNDIWANVTTLPGTLAAHFVRPLNISQIANKPYSAAPAELLKIHSLKPTKATTHVHVVQVYHAN